MVNFEAHARYATRGLIFGVKPSFDLISTVGFGTFFHENFGQAYCTVHPILGKKDDITTC